jgi:sterol desaturase/sphingolipid hydroxylase (fatty acid hydroxylase superfamily)
MANIIDSLGQLTPVIIIVSLAIFMTLENLLPFLTQSAYRKKQKWHNIGNLAVSFVFNASLSGVITGCIMYANQHKFGFLHLLPIPTWISFILGILFCDLNSYVAHRLYHRVPLFWRFHRVHHSDVELDATSALRLHPFEFIFQAVTQATILPLLGVSMASFVIYFTIALPLFIINHANLKYPRWFERVFSIVFITPDWHRVHHSSRQVETDSNYADVFSFWDRFFGTHKTADIKEIQFGLNEQREHKDQTLLAQLKTPFIKIE